MKQFRTRLLACAGILGLAATGSPALADALSTPSMAGPLAANPNPFSIDTTDWLGDAGGKIYIGGAVSGLAFWQSSPIDFNAGDDASFMDLSNAQVFIQKTDGWLQFYVQAGAYSLPTLGTGYLKSGQVPTDTYGYVPVAYAKLVGEGDWSSFSIEAGKLPTLIGDEYTFTFQNMNIERGLLWAQEPAISTGVQANYTAGPLTVSVSLNDGYYSNRWNWLSGLVSYGFNSGADTLAFTAGGNMGHTFYSPTVFGTPIPQNNGSIYDLIYTHTSGPWVVSPYVQYSTIPTTPVTPSASLWGGGLLASYSFDDNWKIAARGEYEGASGSGNITGYGPGSSAWSITLTPSYQWKIFFARADVSYVGLSSGAPGFQFGLSGNNPDQVRAMFEAGILF
jgi:hypothetical protein